MARIYLSRLLFAKNNLRFTILLTFIFTLLTSTQLAYANNKNSSASCLKLENTMLQAPCLSKIKTKVEKELTLWHNNHIFNLTDLEKSTGRSDLLIVFKRSMKDFVDYRESHCRWQYLNTPSTEQALITYQHCFIQLTQQRVDLLTYLDK